MNEEIKEIEEEKKTPREKWHLILLGVFGPLVVGTIIRILFFIAEHADEIAKYVWNELILSISDFFMNLMETNIFFYLLITFVVNWFVGVVFFLIIIFMAAID